MTELYRDTTLNEGAPAGWERAVVEVRSNPPLREPNDMNTARLYAVVGTWNEEDVVEATVMNLFENGCERVFVVDNASEDATRERAGHAGAEVAASYRTDYYDDDRRMSLMNEVMARVTGEEKPPDLWWLSLDADEFPCSPCGGRLIDHLRRMPNECDAAGAVSLDLYPAGGEAYLRLQHPADCLSLAMLRRGPGYCGANHWKHPLLRCRDGVYAAGPSRGSHAPFAPPPQRTLLELPDSVPLFHCPYREHKATEARLRKMCEKRDGMGQRTALDDLVLQGEQGAAKRHRSLEAVYAGDWGRVEVPHAQQFGGGKVGVAPVPWRSLVKFEEFPRWQGAVAALSPVQRAVRSHVLKNVARALSEANAPFWLDWGSLLGVVRDGDLLPWDGDVDLGAWIGDRERIAGLERPLADSGLAMETGGDRLNFLPSFRVSDPGCPGIWLDIYLWHSRGGEAWMPRASGGLKVGAAHYHVLESVMWEETPLPVPSGFYRYLEFRYGPGWRTPDPFFYRRGGKVGGL